jgi:glutamyl-tRNA synthetase
MKKRIRFAPSPTGYLHLGNARMATLNNFLAIKENADYILRIDDTDFKRVKDEYIVAMKEDLKWLGISWVEEFKQSDRIATYDAFVTQLKQEGIVYACYETIEELDYKKKLQLAKGKPPIYDRSMLNLTQADKEKYELEGRKPHYRLKITHENISWIDLIKGELHFKGENISDPVIIREDGSYLYILTSVLDDVETRITHIIRGEDHVVNTALQIQIFKYLKAEIPYFAHLPLITNNEGEGFSKRSGALSLGSLRRDGITPLALNNYLFALGLGEQNKFYSSVKEIAEVFNLQNYNGAAAKFDESKLLKLNLISLQAMEFADVQAMVQTYLNINIDLDFWNIMKTNIATFQDIAVWHNICYNDNLLTVCENKELIQHSINTIPKDFNEDTWSLWLKDIKEASKLTGMALFHPLRLAFSGQDTGPEFKHLILLIGKDRLEARLKKLVG